MNCANQIAFCRTRMCPCDHVGFEDKCPLHQAGCQMSNGEVPPIKTVMALYESMHGPKLSDQCVAVLREVRRFCRIVGVEQTDPVTRINYDTVEEYVGKLAVKNITKIGACSRLSAFLGRTERAFYRKQGLDVRSFDVPRIEDDTTAYRSKTGSEKLSVLKWYHSLQFSADPRHRIFAMMMFHYAMRNGDVGRLRWKNFRPVGEGMQLEYTPHKTEKSARGRTVKILVSPEDQVELSIYRGHAADDDLVIPRRKGSLDYLERVMNASFKALGVGGNKGLYELRMMCVDRVFHALGAEAASAYSGDDFSTVKTHYADTSSRNLRCVGA